MSKKKGGVLKDFIYFTERNSMSKGGEREKEAASTLSLELSGGLVSRILRS